MTIQTTALVLETNNLRGGGDDQRTTATLERLLRHLREQTRALSRLDQLVVTHDGLSDAAQATLQAAAGVPVRFVRVAPDCGYYQAKNVGFDATSADVVAFGDADCWPEADWLERLLAPFDAPAAERPAVVAGRTTYRRDLLGAAASTIDFMYFPSPLHAGCTRNFYANNVAFQRAVFAQHRYAPADGIYRGHCQVLGLRLQARGVRIRFEPRARTIHRFPDDPREFVKLRLLRGEDAAELTPHLAKAYLPRALHWIGRLAPVAPLTVLGVRFVCSVRAIGHQDMPPVDGRRYAACVAAIAGISAVDAVGSVARSVGGALAGRTPGAPLAEAQSLSYHTNVDGLSA